VRLNGYHLMATIMPRAKRRSGCRHGGKVLGAWLDLTMLAAESPRVIWLRTIEIGTGGKKAHKEARLMVTEKVAAGLHEGWRLMTGASAQSVVKRYRKKVQANARRLSR
jgi:hypothetical protein